MGPRASLLAAMLVICAEQLSLSLAEEADRVEVPKEERERKATRERMDARWQNLRATVVDDAGDEVEVKPVAEPVFSFSESTRETGHLGTMWVWSAQGRPAALLTQSKSYGEPVWGFELVALAEGVSVVMHDDWKWTPKTALKMMPFTDAPAPATSASRRLVQMKNLVGRFTVNEQYLEESIELRLLPRPIYRYQDETADLLDGALFNFAHGTNPEALAVIECHRDGKNSSWSYGFVPLAGAGVSAKLDGKVIWSKDPTRESKSQESYSTWLETVKE